MTCIKGKGGEEGGRGRLEGRKMLLRQSVAPDSSPVMGESKKKKKKELSYPGTVAERIGWI